MTPRSSLGLALNVRICVSCWVSDVLGGFHLHDCDRSPVKLYIPLALCLPSQRPAFSPALVLVFWHTFALTGSTPFCPSSSLHCRPCCHSPFPLRAAVLVPFRWPRSVVPLVLLALRCSCMFLPAASPLATGSAPLLHVLAASAAAQAPVRTPFSGLVDLTLLPAHFAGLWLTAMRPSAVLPDA